MYMSIYIYHQFVDETVLGLVVYIYIFTTSLLMRQFCLEIRQKISHTKLFKFIQQKSDLSAFKQET